MVSPLETLAFGTQRHVDSNDFPFQLVDFSDDFPFQWRLGSDNFQGRSGANHESNLIVGGRTNLPEKYPCQIFHIFPKSRNKNPPNKFGNHQLPLMEEIRLTTCCI